MNYWLTLHYPPLPTPVPLYDYVKEKFKKSGSRVCRHDRVAFYEVAGDSGEGRKAVIAIADVTGNGLEKNQYPGEHPDVWPYMVRCEVLLMNGRVGYDKLRQIVRRKIVFIPGGLIQLTKDQFDQIASYFR